MLSKSRGAATLAIEEGRSFQSQICGIEVLIKA